MHKSHTIIPKLLVVAALVFWSAGFGLHVVLPGPGTCQAGELTPIFPGYPEVFDINGSVLYIEKETIVVDDMSLALTPATTFHSQQGVVGWSAIPVESTVGLLLDEDRSVISVWLIEAGKVNNQETPASGTGRQYKLENGVWTN